MSLGEFSLCLLKLGSVALGLTQYSHVGKTWPPCFPLLWRVSSNTFLRKGAWDVNFLSPHKNEYVLLPSSYLINIFLGIQLLVEKNPSPQDFTSFSSLPPSILRYNWYIKWYIFKVYRGMMKASWWIKTILALFSSLNNNNLASIHEQKWLFGSCGTCTTHQGT